MLRQAAAHSTSSAYKPHSLVIPTKVGIQRLFNAQQLTTLDSPVSRYGAARSP